MRAALPADKLFYKLITLNVKKQSANFAIEQLYSSTSDREKRKKLYKINTEIQPICKLSSGHL